MRVLNDDEICFTSVDAIFKRSKQIKGTVHTVDVKSGCGTSVGPSLNPYSLSVKTYLVTLSL